jgi:hypothetical protein
MRGALFVVVAIASAVSANVGFGQQSSPVGSDAMAPDARSYGMGRALLAVAEGPSAIWFNPAALGFGDGNGFSISASRSQLVPDFADDVWLRNASVSWRGTGVGAGVHYTRLSYGKTATDEEGHELGVFTSWDDTFIAGVGVEALRLLAGGEASGGGFGGEPRLGIGASVKRMRTNLAPAWATPEGRAGKADAFDFDLAVLGGIQLIAPQDEPRGGGGVSGLSPSVTGAEARLGYKVKNALGSELEYVDADQADPVGRWDRIGVALDVATERYDILGPFLRVLIAADVDGLFFKEEEGAEPIYNVGAEACALGVLSLRAGSIHDKDGDIRDPTWGVGLGCDLHGALSGIPRIGFRLDYADVPQARALGRVDKYALAAWIEF